MKLLPTALLCLASNLASLASAAAEPPPPPTLMVPMRDGIRLATDVYLPSETGSFPVILARTPYNKNSAAGIGREAAQRGYGFVAQDVRGRYASEGDNLPFDRDVNDGFDTVRWLRKQPWCNGRIGTWGGSAGAITQLHLAASGTRDIAAQHIVVGAPRLYHDGIYPGGVFRKAMNEDWLRISQFAPHALDRWVDRPIEDAYWRDRDLTRRYRHIHAPAVHIGGYWDIFAQGTIDAFVGYQERGGRGARGQQKLLLGPWTHSVLQDKAGELSFPGGRRPPGNVHDAWRWFDSSLRGKSNGMDQVPPVTYYVVGDATDSAAPGNTWRTAAAWPPVPTTATTYYLHADGGFSTDAPDPAAPPRTYTYDPADPAPTIGGIQLTLPAGPMNQQALAERPDVVVFNSATLSSPLEITGRIRARLWVSSDAPDTDFFVTLCDTYPDGRSFNLVEGRLRARFRKGFDRECFLKPGKVYPLNIDLWSTSVIVNRGHRLRVLVTSSSSPGFDPNPNTGAPFRSSSERRVARNAIHVDQHHPSQLILPIAR